jgi:hypothetical protein
MTIDFIMLFGIFFGCHNQEKPRQSGLSLLWQED